MCDLKSRQEKKISERFTLIMSVKLSQMERKVKSHHEFWVGRGVTWVNCCQVCAAALSEPLPHYSLFCGYLLQTPLQSLLGKYVIFVIPTYSLPVPIILLVCMHRLSKEHQSLLFTYSTNILVRLLTGNMKNCLTPKIRKCATPSLKMQPHDSQSSHENATPSSGTSPLVSHKKEPHSPPPGTSYNQSIHAFPSSRLNLIGHSLP